MRGYVHIRDHYTAAQKTSHGSLCDLEWPLPLRVDHYDVPQNEGILFYQQPQSSCSMVVQWNLSDTDGTYGPTSWYMRICEKDAYLWNAVWPNNPKEIT